MYPVLFHIYGPINIYSYSVAILVGLILFFWQAQKHSLRKRFISSHDFFNLLIESALAGIIGGRLLHVISEWHYYSNGRLTEIVSIWNGGVSILGTVIALLLYVPFYVYKHKIALLPVLDLAALYAPLLQGISRIGCFLAGCCYGCSTAMPWGILYSHPEVRAPLGIKLHPTQLYSVCVFLSIFFIIQAMHKKMGLKQGQLASIYLILLSLERFTIDFFRGDRVTGNILSFHQWIAFALFILGCACFVFLRYYKHTIARYESV